LRQSQRPDSHSHNAHFNDALEGCLTDASKSLTSSFAQLLGRCVALLQEYVAGQDAASETKAGAAVVAVVDAKADALAEGLLRVCALDYELSDHAMLHDSGLLQVQHCCYTSTVYYFVLMQRITLTVECTFRVLVATPIALVVSSSL
jgi:hypothetical protein